MKELPNEIAINLKDMGYQSEDEELDNFISEWLSNTYEYCHNGFAYVPDPINGNILVFDIDWDISA